MRLSYTMALLMAAISASDASECGLAGEWTFRDRSLLQANESCLSEPVEMSILDRLYRAMLVASSEKANLRMLVKNWDAHALNSAIIRILIEEVLGYEPPQICSTASGWTAGSFDLLSTIDGRDAEADLDMELWASSAFDEYQAASGKYVDAGNTFSYARSGLYLRPGGDAAARAHAVAVGGSYRNLIRDVVPTLPTLEQVRNLSSLWCNVSPDGHCLEAPNRACLEAGSEACRVLLKSDDSADRGQVEEMIRNASLPLVVVYTGGSFDFLSDLPDQSWLFYHWEPHVLIAPNTDIVRVTFEDPIMCEGNESFVKLPPLFACDFRLGQVHKGYSNRVETYFPDVAHLIESYQVPSADILEMESMVKSGTHNHYDVACGWVRDNVGVWESWLLNPRKTTEWKKVLPILFISVVGAVALVWSMLPILADVPDAFSQWFYASQWFKPTRMTGGLYVCTMALIRTIKRIYRSLRRVTKAASDYGAQAKRRATKHASRLGDAVGAGASAIGLHHLSRRTQSRENTAERRPPLSGRRSVWDNTRRRLKHSAEGYKDKTYTSRQRVAASFLQQFFRTRSLEEALKGRARAKERLRDGIQFVQRTMWALEGDDHFHVGVMRGSARVSERVQGRVVATNAGLSTLYPGRDYELKDDRVVFAPGERFAFIEIKLLDNGVSIKGDITGSWLPVRELRLDLKLEEPDDLTMMGEATTCNLKLVDSDDWPCKTKGDFHNSIEDRLNTRNSLFSLYVYQILRESLENEMWWFVGLLLRSINGVIIRNLLGIILFDLAIDQRSLDWSFIVAAGYLGCELVNHITSYWYNSSWAMGYDVTLTWLMAKWTTLPLTRVVEAETTARYRGMIDLITSSFFGENNYSVFGELVDTWLNIVIATLAPLLLFNLSLCNASDEVDGVCTVKDRVRLKWDPSQFTLSIVVMMGTIAIVLAYHMLNGFCQTRYEREVRHYINYQRELTGDVLSLIDNTPLYHTFDNLNQELKKVIDSMSRTRNQKFTYLLALDASGKGYDWSMIFIYAFVMMASPALYGIADLTIGQIYALFTLIVQGKSIMTSLSGSTERLRIARYLLGELADLLNEGGGDLRKNVDNSLQKYTAVRRAVHDLNVVSLDIVFYRMRYVGAVIDTDGTVGKVNLEGKLPTGRLLGLASPKGCDATSLQQELDHRVIIDLMSGARTPTDGAVIIAPHLKVGVVPHTPTFIASRTLLENLKYGCCTANAMPAEATIWHVCLALGLPRHLFNADCGSLSMRVIADSLSSTELQLMSIARSMLGLPDVLLVHNLGEMEPRVAQRVGVIFSMYVRGCALGLLTGSFGAPRGHSQSPAKQKKKPKASVPPVANDEVRRPSCAPDSSNPLNPFPEPSARSAAFTTTLDEHSGHDDTLDHAAPRSRDGNDLESDRRTVIWHAMSDVLETAFVDKCFIYRGGRLRRYHHATSTSFATADSAAPAPSSGPTQPPPPPPESPWLSRIDSAPTPPWLPHPASRTAKQAGRTSASSVSFGPAKLTAITEPSSSQADGDVREVLATPTVPDEEAQHMRV